jgi:hypothetical protein
LWGSFLVLAPLETSYMASLELLRVFMGIICIVIKGIHGRSWQACLVGGTCCGALGEISMSPVFLVKYWVMLVFVLPWWGSLILSWALWTFPLLEGILHGQTIGICFLGQELTGFLSLWIGMPSFLICLKEDYLDFAQTVFPFSLIVAVFIVAEDTLSLRTYG